MIRPEELKKIADDKKVLQAIDFCNMIIPKLEKRMIEEATKGLHYLLVYEDDELNISSWLSKESLHDAVINALNNEGFKSYYDYDYSDGAYVKITWD